MAKVCGNMEKQYVHAILAAVSDKLQLDYFHLFLVHSHIRISHTVTDLTNIAEDDKLGYDESRVAGIWEGMEEAMSKGLTRAIGISNFTITKTESLLKTAKIVPAVNQVECHPYFQQKKLREYCDTKEHGSQSLVKWEQQCKVALKVGYRHLDCAHIYQNEAEIGEALQKCFEEGVCKRENLFVTSKLWAGDMEEQYVLPAIQLTLKNLQLDYLDLYLIHSPFAFRHNLDMSNLQEEEKLGYDESRIAGIWKTESLLKNCQDCTSCQPGECHPYFQQKKLREYCDSKGILIEAYAPLGSPARRGVEATDPVVMDDPTIKEIASKKGATPAQICISFLLHRGFVVIPKSVTPHRIQDNFEATKVSLSAG
ncbi:Aldo-keto reductase family 1 member B10 [Geodia barretti]|uniref:Aldo-keto reductase family 1 member B10 n=1 Tax=Geodia barretti TaxID=519541 RepID=A0AA35S0Z3_GEOBA|nr:Aldo-keto reductase family 1 member B10 [Geodia barretti]